MNNLVVNLKYQKMKLKTDYLQLAENISLVNKIT